MSLASHQPIWLWQSLNVEYLVLVLWDLRRQITCGLRENMLLYSNEYGRLFHLQLIEKMSYLSKKNTYDKWKTNLSFEQLKKKSNQDRSSTFKLSHNQIDWWHATDINHLFIDINQTTIQNGNQTSFRTCQSFRML